jgi:hypothetical protein
MMRLCIRFLKAGRGKGPVEKAKTAFAKASVVAWLWRAKLAQQIGGTSRRGNWGTGGKMFSLCSLGSFAANFRPSSGRCNLPSARRNLTASRLQVTCNQLQPTGPNCTKLHQIALEREETPDHHEEPGSRHMRTQGTHG